MTGLGISSAQPADLPSAGTKQMESLNEILYRFASGLQSPESVSRTQLRLGHLLARGGQGEVRFVDSIVATLPVCPRIRKIPANKAGSTGL